MLHSKSWKWKGLENEDRNIDGLQKLCQVSENCLVLSEKLRDKSGNFLVSDEWQPCFWLN